MLTEKELNVLCKMLKAAMLYGYNKGRDEVHAHEKRNVEQFSITPARRLSILNKLTKSGKSR